MSHDQIVIQSHAINYINLTLNWMTQQHRGVPTFRFQGTMSNNKRSQGTEELGTISPDIMRGSEHVSIVDETSESHDLEDDEMNDLEDNDTQAIVEQEQGRRRGRSGGPRSRSPPRAQSSGSGSTASSRFRRTSLAQKPNLWQQRQEATVDQSVNLMDSKTTTSYEADSVRGSGRGGRIRPAMTPNIRQKSMMDIFLDQDEPMGGHGSFRGSAHFSDTGERTLFERKMRLFLVFVAVLLIAVTLALTLPGFGLIHSMSDSNDEVAATAAIIAQQHPNLEQVPNSTALEAFRFYVVDQDISEAAQLDTMGSPTKKALHWITQKDPAKLPIPGYNQDLATSTAKAEYALLQRYALAVFYYSQQAISTTNVGNAGRHLQENNTAKIEEELANRELFDSNWLSADHICRWHGVVCAKDSESVLEVNLPNHLLQGSIPREFLDGAAMPFLTQVDLSGNQLQGQLPQVTQERESVGQQLGVEPLQTQLKVLRLGHNDIAGKLDQLVGLTKLKEVDLSRNEITGSLPDSIVGLAKLGKWCALRMCLLSLKF